MKRTDAGLIATSFRTIGDVGVFRPRSLDEAVRILTEADLPPTLVAGGTDVVAQFNEGLMPAHMLALSRIGELTEIRQHEESLHLGALATHAAGSANAVVRRSIPAFATAWGRIANRRVGFTATLGGNLMARRTRYEMPILLSALRARVHLLNAAGEQSLEAENVAQHKPSGRDILTHAVVPLQGLLAFDYDRSLRPVMTLALCIRRNEDGLHVRAVIGTAAMAPYAIDHAAGHDDLERLARSARDTARAVLLELPANVHDPQTSNAYLRGAGTALLARQLERIAYGAA